MRYTLYLGAAADDKRAAYAWLLYGRDGVIASDVYLTRGERKSDESYCGHIALQRALRKVAQQEGVIQLRIALDDTVADAVGYEVMDVDSPLYPTLCRTSKRILRRFDSVEFASFSKNESDAAPGEIAVIDDALDALEQAATLSGTLRLWRDCVLRPSKIIR